jgi:hypothetical protein
MYFVTKLMIEIPGMLVPIWISTTIVYLIVGLEGTFSNWLLYCNILHKKELVFTLAAVCGYLLGIIVGILCK